MWKRKRRIKRYGRLSKALLRSMRLSRRARIVLKRGLRSLCVCVFNRTLSLWLSPSFLSHPNRSTWIWPRWRHRLGSRWEKPCVSLWGFFFTYLFSQKYHFSFVWFIPKERKCVKVSTHQIESVWWFSVLSLYSFIYLNQWNNFFERFFYQPDRSFCLRIVDSSHFSELLLELYTDVKQKVVTDFLKGFQS